MEWAPILTGTDPFGTCAAAEPRPSALADASGSSTNPTRQRGGRHALGDFFGFFGALKKGPFFVSHPKKVLLNKHCRRAASPVPRESVFLKLCQQAGLRKLQEIQTASRGPCVRKQNALDRNNQRTFFGSTPKKSCSPEFVAERKKYCSGTTSGWRGILRLDDARAEPKPNTPAARRLRPVQNSST
jgi:hypothetical protein